MGKFYIRCLTSDIYLAMDVKKTNYLYSNRNEETVTEFIINSIRKALENGDLKPKDRLPSENELAEALSVSRSSVREAMKYLLAYGVINIQRGKGTFISDNTDSKGFINPILFNFLFLKPEQKEIEDYRYFIERSVMEEAIKNADSEDISLLCKNLEQMGSFDSPCEKTVELEMEFHRIIGKSTKNRLLEKTYQIAMEFFYPTIEKTHYKQKCLEETLNLHKITIDILKEKKYEDIEKLLLMNNEIWMRLSK